MNVALYKGEMTVCVECPASGRCGHERFFCNPPDAEDECAARSDGGDCKSEEGRLYAMRAAHVRLGDEIAALAEELKAY